MDSAESLRNFDSTSRNGRVASAKTALLRFAGSKIAATYRLHGSNQPGHASTVTRLASVAAQTASDNNAAMSAGVWVASDSSATQFASTGGNASTGNAGKSGCPIGSGCCQSIGGGAFDAIAITWASMSSGDTSAPG